MRRGQRINDIDVLSCKEQRIMNEEEDLKQQIANTSLASLVGYESDDDDVGLAAPEDTEWQECKDEKTGATYYWNTSTGQVSWEKPQGEDDKIRDKKDEAVDAEDPHEQERVSLCVEIEQNLGNIGIIEALKIKSKVHTRNNDWKAGGISTEFLLRRLTEVKEYLEKVGQEEEQVAEKALGNEEAEQKVPAPNTKSCSGTVDKSEYILPQGWTRLQDPSTQRVFYHHAPTNTTSWELPPGASPESTTTKRKHPEPGKGDGAGGNDNRGDSLVIHSERRITAPEVANYFQRHGHRIIRVLGADTFLVSFGNKEFASTALRTILLRSADISSSNTPDADTGTGDGCTSSSNSIGGWMECKFGLFARYVRPSDPKEMFEVNEQQLFMEGAVKEEVIAKAKEDAAARGDDRGDREVTPLDATQDPKQGKQGEQSALQPGATKDGGGRASSKPSKGSYSNGGTGTLRPVVRTSGKVANSRFHQAAPKGGSRTPASAVSAPLPGMGPPPSSETQSRNKKPKTKGQRKPKSSFKSNKMVKCASMRV